MKHNLQKKNLHLFPIGKILVVLSALGAIISIIYVIASCICGVN